MKNPNQLLCGVVLLAAILLGCAIDKPDQAESAENVAQWKEELRQLEAAHMDTAAKYGFMRSLLFFTGDEFALIDRGADPILTLDSIKRAVAKMPAQVVPPDYKLEWKPAFIDVSPSGDMGYTYGYYQVIPNDTTLDVEHGSYLTIWKKNREGKWKLVVD